MKQEICESLLSLPPLSQDAESKNENSWETESR